MKEQFHLRLPPVKNLTSNPVAGHYDEVKQVWQGNKNVALDATLTLTATPGDNDNDYD